MARVSATRSGTERPRKNTAMAKEAAWPSETWPEVSPSMKLLDLLGIERAAVALAADDFLRKKASSQ